MSTDLILLAGGGAGVVGSPTAVTRRTYNAADFPGGAAETRIEAMLVRALADGVSFGVIGYIPGALLPYNPINVPHLAAFGAAGGRLICEGGKTGGVYDFLAYGANRMGATSAAPSILAALAAASVSVATAFGRSVKSGTAFGSPGIYATDVPLVMPEATILRGSGPTETSIVAMPGFSGAAIITAGNDAGTGQWSSVLDLEVLGNKGGGASANGILFTCLGQLSQIRNVFVDHLTGWGIKLTTVNGSQLGIAVEDCWVLDPGDHCLIISKNQGLNSVKRFHGELMPANKAAVYIDGTGASVGGANALEDIQCEVNAHPCYAVWVNASAHNTLDHVTLDSGSNTSDVVVLFDVDARRNVARDVSAVDTGAKLLVDNQYGNTVPGPGAGNFGNLVEYAQPSTGSYRLEGTDSGMTGDRGNNNVTVVWGDDARTQLFATPFTAPHTFTLTNPASDTSYGASFRVTRSAAATGAFPLTIQNSSTTFIATLYAGQWIEVTWNGFAWQITEFRNPRGSKTYDAADFPGASPEARITAMNNAAHAAGVPYGTIPESFLPYDESIVTYFSDVQNGVENGVYQKGVYDARAYGGSVNAGRAVSKALQMLPASGGVVDARGFTGAQVIDRDIFFDVTAEKPMKVIFGPSTWTVPTGTALAGIGLFFGSDIEINLNGTTFLLADYTSQNAMWNTDITAGVTGSASVTNGSATVTIPSLTRGVVPKRRKCVAIFGHTPNGGRDNTTLAAAINDTTGTSITLTSVGVPPGGIISDGATQYVRIDNEIISFPLANCATGASAVWTGGTRGALGSVAATHANGAPVDRVVYENYSIVEVAGTGPWTVTLDRPVTMAPTMTNVQLVIGPANVTISGAGTLDGGMPPGETVADTSNNALAVIFYFGTRLKVERSVHFQNWEHGCVHTAQSRFCVVDGSFRNTGHPQTQIGFSVTFFSGSKYCTAYGDYENVNTGPCSDDRTTHSQYYDNLIEGCHFFPRSIRNVLRGVVIEGTANSYALVPFVDNWQWAGFTTGYAVGISQPQWVTAPGTLADNNVIRVGWVSPQSGAVNLAAATQNSLIDLGVQQRAVYGTSPIPVSSGRFYSPLQMLNNYQVSVGIAPTSAEHTALYLNVSIPTSLGNASYGVVADITHPATSTGAGYAIFAKARTVAAAYTVAALAGISVQDAFKGAGSAITTQYGIKVEDQTQGVTNFAIVTGLGTVSFGDRVKCGNGVQVTAGNLAVSSASAPVTHVGMWLNQTLTGQTFAHGFLAQPTVDATSVTSNLRALSALPATAATAGTIAAVYGVYVFNPSKGAGSTITTAYGLFIEDQTQGGTNFAIKTGLGSVVFGTDPGGTDLVRVGGALTINSAALMIRTKTSFTDGAAAQAGTLTNAPVAGNPTKWISIDDNGVTRKIPAW